MTRPDTRPLHDLEARTRRGDPHFAHGPRTARPHRPREHRRRRGRSWALLALSLAMLVMGMVLPQGLLLVSGLVTAAVATHLLAPPPDPDRSLYTSAHPVRAAITRA